MVNEMISVAALPDVTIEFDIQTSMKKIIY